MAKTPERAVKDACEAILKTYKAYYFFPVTGGYGRSGVPDIIACYAGRMVAVECKAGYNQPTALQLRELARIEEAGGIALVIREDTTNLLIETLERIRNRK